MSELKWTTINSRLRVGVDREGRGAEVLYIRDLYVVIVGLVEDYISRMSLLYLRHEKSINL